MKDKIEKLEVTDLEKADFLNWMNKYGLEEIYKYQEHWKFVTDTSEKFNEKDHGKVCVICKGNPDSRWKNGLLYCTKHLKHMLRHNKILSVTPYTPNEFIIEDRICYIVVRYKSGEVKEKYLIDDFNMLKCMTHKWYSSGGYVKYRREGTPLHRHILELKKDDKHKGDHINGNTYDNRECNLRAITDQQNSFNYKLSKNNTSKVSGVWFDKRAKKWVAEIKINYKKISLGRSIEFDEAVKIRLNGEVHHMGKFSPQRHLFKEYNIDTKGIIFDEGKEYKRPIEMTLKRALELYKILEEI